MVQAQNMVQIKSYSTRSIIQSPKYYSNIYKES